MLGVALVACVGGMCWWHVLVAGVCRMMFVCRLGKLYIGCDCVLGVFGVFGVFGVTVVGAVINVIIFCAAINVVIGGVICAVFV